MTITVDDAEITSITASFDSDEIEIRGTWESTVEPIIPAPGFQVPPTHRFPAFDNITWHLGQTILVAGSVFSFRSHANGTAEARASSSDPWRLMTPTTQRDARSALTFAPEEFVEEGEFRIRVPRSALVPPTLGGTVIGSPLQLRMSFGYLWQRRERNPTFTRHTVTDTIGVLVDETDPRVAIWVPGSGSNRRSPVTIAGTVTDAGTSAGIQDAEVGVRDDETNQWFDFATNTWTSNERFRDLALDFTNPQAATFSTTWREVGGSQHYRAVVRSIDRRGNEHRSERPFFVDRLRPRIERLSPRVVVGPTLPIEFAIDDDGTIERIHLSISDMVTEQFWNNASESWQNNRLEFRQAFTATSDGAVVAYSFSPPDGSTHYNVGIRVVDQAGNQGRAHMTVRLLPVDDTAPDTLIFHPAADGDNLVPGLITFRGRVSDDVTPASVLLRIRDRDTDQDWNGASWQAANASVLAEMAAIPEPRPG
ncbi:MAG: hypothetical protein AAF467_09085, partial [Actinomycetota bacterium]